MVSFCCICIVLNRCRFFDSNFTQRFPEICKIGACVVVLDVDVSNSHCIGSLVPSLQSSNVVEQETPIGSLREEKHLFFDEISWKYILPGPPNFL